MEEKKVKSQIKKQSYYSFPNGVEAEDICRYLSFNLGNVVKYICRAGKKDKNTKIQDLVKARDYLNNEIELCEEKNKDTNMEEIKEVHWVHDSILFNDKDNKFATYASVTIPNNPDKFLAQIVVLPNGYKKLEILDKKDYRLATNSEILQFYRILNTMGKDWDPIHGWLTDFK